MNLDPVQKREAMKIGRRKVGEAITYRNGVSLLVLQRSMKDVVRGKGNSLISHAMEEEQACWPVETLLLSRMKMRHIHLLAIKVRENKAIYISRLSSWIDDSAIYNRKRNGSFQRILPFGYFTIRPGIMKL